MSGWLWFSHSSEGSFHMSSVYICREEDHECVGGRMTSFLLLFWPKMKNISSITSVSLHLRCQDIHDNFYVEWEKHRREKNSYLSSPEWKRWEGLQLADLKIRVSLSSFLLEFQTSFSNLSCRGHVPNSSAKRYKKYCVCGFVCLFLFMHFRKVFFKERGCSFLLPIPPSCWVNVDVITGALALIMDQEATEG